MKYTEDGLKKFDRYGYYDEVDIDPGERCIYILKCGEYGAVYVGQSINIQRRLKEHRRHLFFDKVDVYVYDDTVDLYDKENEKINKCNPHFNGHYVKYEKYHNGGPLRYEEVWKRLVDIERYEKLLSSM